MPPPCGHHPLRRPGHRGWRPTVAPSTTPPTYEYPHRPRHHGRGRRRLPPLCVPASSASTAATARTSRGCSTVRRTTAAGWWRTSRGALATATAASSAAWRRGSSGTARRWRRWAFPRWPTSRPCSRPAWTWCSCTRGTAASGSSRPSTSCGRASPRSSTSPPAHRWRTCWRSLPSPTLSTSPSSPARRCAGRCRR